MKPTLPLLAALAFLGGCSLQQGVGMTHEQADQIIAELKDIKRVLVEQHAKAAEPEGPAKVQLDENVGTSLGAADAPVVLVEFTDYQCPFCKRFHDRTWPDIKKKYVDTGKVRFVVRDLPLPFHGEALPAAAAIRCAGEQRQFWKVYESLFATPGDLTDESIRKSVLDAGVQAGPFDACLKKPAIKEAIDADTAEAERIGVTGTPGFVIARRVAGKLEGTLVLGAQPTATFAAKFDELLGAAKP